MNGGAITEARVDEAVPSCVRIAGGGIFIMNGTVINGENAEKGRSMLQREEHWS